MFHEDLGSLSGEQELGAFIPLFPIRLVVEVILLRRLEALGDVFPFLQGVRSGRVGTTATWQDRLPFFLTQVWMARAWYTWAHSTSAIRLIFSDLLYY